MLQPASLDVEKLALEIDARVQALPDLKTDTVRALRREFSKRIAQAGPQDVYKLALLLLEFPRFEYHFLAYELIAGHRATLRSLGVKEIERLGRGLDSWYSVDTFASLLSGPAWRENQISDSAVHRWARSKDRWWRRAALVSTVALNNRSHGGRGDVARTLRMCEMLVGDYDDMVVKALSWALRMLIVHDSEAVRQFLADHQDELAARVVREVNNKLKTGLKNPKG